MHLWCRISGYEKGVERMIETLMICTEEGCKMIEKKGIKTLFFGNNYSIITLEKEVKNGRKRGQKKWYFLIKHMTI